MIYKYRGRLSSIRGNTYKGIGRHTHTALRAARINLRILDIHALFVEFYGRQPAILPIGAWAILPCREEGSTFRMPCAASASGNVAFCDGVSNELCCTLEVELFHYPCAMMVHGSHTDVQIVGDLLVGKSLGHQLEDFSLAN